METSPEQIATQLISLLKQRLGQNEDAETAISVYKTANWIISQLEEVKNSSLELAEEDMRARELDHLRTPAGSAGWTEPKARQLHESAWLNAIANDLRLMRIQREYDMAEAALNQAQDPYYEVPEPWFFIR